MPHQPLLPSNLEEAINFYSVIMDTDPNGIFIYSLDGRLIECNSAACMMHGFTKDEMLAMAPKDFIHPDGYQTFLDFNNALQEQGWFKGESVGTTRDKHRFDVEVYGRICRVNGVSYLYSTIRDITEEKLNIKKIEEAKLLLQKLAAEANSAKSTAEKAWREAEEANRAKSAFLTNMSHEIRTPLAAMRSSIECIATTKIEKPGTDVFIDILLRNCEHLTELINDILDLSKVESGALDLMVEPIDVLAIITGVAELLSTNARKKNVTLGVKSVGLEGLEIKSDALILRQILINILGNAVKFSENGGTVTIEASAETLSGLEEEVTLAIIVKDQGCGIAEKDFDKLFRPFSQVDATMTRRHGGTGLGLILARKLAQSLGGDVKLLASAAGQGSSFLITLKCQRIPGTSMHAVQLASLANQQSSPAAKPLVRKKILVVEDDGDIRLVFRQLLQHAGAEVSLASNGQEGVELALAQAFDVVVMDMKMPVLDGYEATKTLRSSGYQMPIIAVTAHSGAENKAKCLSAGCDAYMCKPVDRKALIELINKF